jgi:hypothetical protein
LYVVFTVKRDGWLADEAYGGGTGTHAFQGYHGTVPDAIRAVIDENGLMRAYVDNPDNVIRKTDLDGTVTEVLHNFAHKIDEEDKAKTYAIPMLIGRGACIQTMWPLRHGSTVAQSS